MKESWTITTPTPKDDDLYLLIDLSWKGKELVVCNVMMYALRNDEICVVCILHAYAINVVEM